MSSVRPKHGAGERKQETLWEERVRDAGLGQSEGGTSNAACPTHSPALQSAGDGGETAPAGRLAEGKAFLLALAVTAFPSVTDIPLKSSVSPLHTPVQSRGCRTSVPLWTRRHFGWAVGTSPAQLLPHSTSRAHKWEKLVTGVRKAQGLAGSRFVEGAGGALICLCPNRPK